MNYDIAKQLYDAAMTIMANDTEWVKKTISILRKNNFTRFADSICEKLNIN